MAQNERNSETMAEAIHFVMATDELINNTARALIGGSDSAAGELEGYMARGASEAQAALMWMNDNYCALKGAIVAAGALIGSAAETLL